MWEAAECLVWTQSDAFEGFLDLAAGFILRVCQAEALERCLQHVVDAVEGVERLVWVLKDRLDLATELAPLSG